MIEIRIKKDPENLRIWMKTTGHAGTAPKGRDTVCAAVSALVYGFAKEIALIDGGRFHKQIVSVGDKDGSAVVDLHCVNERTYKRILYNLAPMERSLEMLAIENPQAVRIY